MKRHLLSMTMVAAGVAALATPVSLLTVGAAQAGAAAPKSIPCTKVTGSASSTGKVTITNCTVPTADKTLYKSASAPVTGLITGKGKITWSSSKKTTALSVTFAQATTNKCTGGASEYTIKGKVVTGGNAAITPVGQVVSLSICLSSTNAVTLAPHTTAEL